MSYFQKHRGTNRQQQNNTSPQTSSPFAWNKKSFCHANTNFSQELFKSIKPKEPNPVQLFSSAKSHYPFNPTQPQKESLKAIPQREIPSLMLDGESSMQELLNSSINQFTKYLSDRDDIEEEHQQLVAQNKDLRKTLEKLKIIIKQKLVSALTKQREELNIVMQDYVQLITKLLADKQQLTATLEHLEKKFMESQQKCEMLQKKQSEAHIKVEDMGKERQMHIAKTKQQIDDFLHIIEQYEEEADEEGREGELLKQRIAELQKQLSKTNLTVSQSQQSVPSKTQILLEMLEKAQEENRVLLKQRAGQNCRQKLAEMQRQHEQQFMEYQRAMRETLSKKDECIARLSSIIESYRERLGKDSSSNSTLQVGSPYK